MTDTILWRGFQVLPYNVPENRPGAYRFECLENGKCYNGISASIKRRIGNSGDNYYQHAGPKINNAIKKYGKSAFLLTPTFYLIEELNEYANLYLDNIENIRKATIRFLSEIEADHIFLTDSVKNGYNIIAAYGGVGPYGPEFGATIRAALIADPSITKRQASSLKATHAADPKIGQQIGTSLRLTYHADPTINERRIAAIKATFAADPTIGDRISAAIKTTLTADPTIVERREIIRQATLAADPTIVKRQAASRKITIALDPTITQRQIASHKATLAADPTITERRVAVFKATIARRRANLILTFAMWFFFGEVSK